MKTLQEMLRELAKPEVVEFAVASDRLPCVKIGDQYHPVDDTPRPTDGILEMLTSAGGSRYVDDLETRPAAWTLRVDGLGTVEVRAITHAGRVQARFKLASRAVARGPEPPRRPDDRDSEISDPMLRGALVKPPPKAAPREPPKPPKQPTLTDLLEAARAVKATDLHVVAGRQAHVRVGGELTPLDGAAVVTEATAQEILGPIVPERLAAVLAEHGSCDFALEFPPHGRFRVNVSRQRTGLKGCFRCIPPGVPTLASLGLPPEIERATHHHQGLVLVTGPTGHGKTSTLAAIVDILNRETTHHIILVEDPVEYIHPRKKAMISQREVGTHTKTFAAALKASLREDPDVIVVGELRDTETVRMALAASETGHLVLGTMNTPNAAKTIDRLVDLFPPDDQQQVRMTLAGGLHLIVSQRLIPDVGGQSMAVAVELLPGSVALWSLIRDNKTFQIPSLQQRGKGFGIVRLDESLADLVRAGRTTREAALAVAEDPEELDAVLAGKRAPVAADAKPKPEAAGILGKAGGIFGKRGG
ncbi:MAG TPA: PilT/PilU family type 4a pilus ATPase [Polyangiaceae bacterium]|nr:PilT/PilU family type 4a pilus ATPase [Polyangiaceae bacterium]